MTSDTITIIKDICLSIAALTTTCVAWRGLNSWKKEKKGNIEYDLAKNLLKTIYKLRDELKYSRSPFIPFSEYPENHDPSNKSEDNLRSLYSHVFYNRWKPVLEVYQQLEILALEAEVIWPIEIKSKLDEFRNHIKDFKFSLDEMVGYESDRPDHKDEFYQKHKHIVYDLNKEDNAFSKTINLSIQEIQNSLRPKLQK